MSPDISNHFLGQFASYSSLTLILQLYIIIYLHTYSMSDKLYAVEKIL